MSKVLLTKITPPRVSPRTLIRARVSEELRRAMDFRLTILQAGAGYGKTTALAAFSGQIQPLIWYQVSPDDGDPLVFLLHLCHATQQALPYLEGLPFSIFETWDDLRSPNLTQDLIYQYLNALTQYLVEPVMLVIDDAHRVMDSTEVGLILDQLCELAPPKLHLLLASRTHISLPSLSRWRARGEVYYLDQSDLAFTAAEIETLFSKNYGYVLAREEADALYEATEGWAITLPLIWQSLRSGVASTIEDAIAYQQTSLESLFDVLADEVLALQPPDVQAFLEISATLQVMTPESCDALWPAADSSEMLTYLQREELFVIEEVAKEVGGQESLRLRYQHVFHRFLRQRTQDKEKRRLWNQQAAKFFQLHGDAASAIYHLLKAKDHFGAAELLASYGRQLIDTGRLDTLANYLDDLPPGAFHQFPILLTYLGDLARLQSRFDEALSWYKQAETLWRDRGNKEGIGRALRGQARIYLDTVNPKQAEEILQETLQMTDGVADQEAQARLYELLAENKLNSGKAQEAEALQRQAAALRREVPDESQLLFRVLLRTGRLAEARQKLEEQAEAERREPVQTPRAHRETQLLLSIIYAFFGEAEAAYQAALEGTRRGVELHSPFITAVGHMRQGHSLMLLPGENRYEDAQTQFQKTIDLGRTLTVPRLGIEANWGLCRVFGYAGDLEKAKEAAQLGIQLATQYGDEWIASLIRLAMGASMVLAGRFESSHDWLKKASQGFRECSDPFGVAGTHLWRCLAYFHQGEHGPLSKFFPEVLSTCRTEGYDFLFTRPTAIGTPDERVLIPLLIHARKEGWETPYVTKILDSLGLREIAFHPGYRLRVQMLGDFQTWRGEQAIPSKGWQRTNTRQLFQLFLTNRDTPLTRDQIMEYLWPTESPSTSQRKLKVALNTLYRVLEPARAPGAESAYIKRDGQCYQLRPEADLWLDTQVFRETLQRAEVCLKSGADAVPLLEKTVALYKGEYLPEARYETWAAAEREHLAVLFLRAADHLCDGYLQQGRLEAVIDLGRRILEQDNCWERAYRYMMTAYHRLGDHGQVARTYSKCVEILREELDVIPSEETEALYRGLIG